MFDDARPSGGEHRAVGEALNGSRNEGHAHVEYTVTAERLHGTPASSSIVIETDSVEHPSGIAVRTPASMQAASNPWTRLPTDISTASGNIGISRRREPLLRRVQAELLV
ncbi:MAG: hypothetical protein R3E97_24395 [Candidatus Eisenbacteria bacterium]